MTNILFFHPGGAAEHFEGRRGWRSNSERHERALLRATGRARDSARSDAATYEGPLTFWGEWEADAVSYALPSASPKGLPTSVLEPAWPSRRTNLGALHNTDPFVFGGPFLYSNCQQPWSPLLRSLQRGDVIFFGSQLDAHFVLDTIFVVRDRYPYIPSRWQEASFPGGLPAAFVEATLGPLSVTVCEEGQTASTDTELVLYVGATPEDAVDGMFSFAPALRARPDAKAFPRPKVCKVAQAQGISRTDIGWNDAVRATESADLFLATSFAAPTGPKATT